MIDGGKTGCTMMVLPKWGRNVQKWGRNVQISKFFSHLWILAGNVVCRSGSDRVRSPKKAQKKSSNRMISSISCSFFVWRGTLWEGGNLATKVGSYCAFSLESTNNWLARLSPAKVNSSTRSRAMASSSTCSLTNQSRKFTVA